MRKTGKIRKVKKKFKIITKVMPLCISDEAMKAAKNRIIDLVMASKLY